MANHLLTFEIDDDEATVHIHGDESGLSFLSNSIRRLLRRSLEGGASHDHLKTEEWGGVELSSESQGHRLIHHVKLHYWPSEDDRNAGS